MKVKNGITNGIVETHMLIETHPYMHEVYEKYTQIVQFQIILLF